MKITKLERVENTDLEYVKESGIIAFQLVKFEYSFYGSQQSSILDTKIMQDGTQIVVDGNGFIKSGYQIN